MRLLIVESPNKVKKILECLGAGFEVVATAGHFRDLPEDALGIDLATFTPTYVVDAEKKGLLARIAARAAQAEEVLLATDADREGEAIAWHLAQQLRLRNARRIRFTEITREALRKAVAAAGPLDVGLVDAQQARRALDRLVGYQVSPLLGVFGTNHSAGRVQSAALHLVAQREAERVRFVAVPYWVVAATYRNGLIARFARRNDAGDVVDAKLDSQAAADAVVQRARGSHRVTSLVTAPVERRPKPPFTTSTLQQAASVQLGLPPARTMELAQRLFEGGHISYHRSDSVTLSAEAVAMARAFLARDYPEALPSSPPVYRSKASAQEAHEAIRPTHLEPLAPEGLAADTLPLYRLIYSRFIASQCRPAVLEQTTVVLSGGDTLWRARGHTIKFLSFLKYVSRDEDSEAKSDEEDARVLPAVAEGDLVEVQDLVVRPDTTKPPPRFTQATLVREMERTGIGRPSTYAATVQTLFDRDYLAEEKKALCPTSRGRLVDAALERAFGALVNTSFTAEMEARLDQVAAGGRAWRDDVRAWYGPFSAALARAPDALAALQREKPELLAGVEAAPRPTGKPCPRCRVGELFLRPGKKSAFLACNRFPGCDYVADPSARPSARPCPKCGKAMEDVDGRFGPYAKCLDAACGATVDQAPVVDERCPRCSGPMKSRGAFLSCARYPECKGTLDVKALAKSRKLDKRCPKCGLLLLERKSAKGKFWGCSGYPTCRHLEPIASRATKTAAGPTRPRP